MLNVQTESSFIFSFKRSLRLLGEYSSWLKLYSKIKTNETRNIIKFCPIIKLNCFVLKACHSKNENFSGTFKRKPQHYLKSHSKYHLHFPIFVSIIKEHVLLFEISSTFMFYKLMPRSVILENNYCAKWHLSSEISCSVSRFTDLGFTHFSLVSRISWYERAFSHTTTGTTK